MNDLSDRNITDYDPDNQNQGAADIPPQKNVSQRPAEQLKQVLGGGLKQPAIPPMNMNKL